MLKSAHDRRISKYGRGDSPGEIDSIKKKLLIEYSNEERLIFDQWLGQVPTSSLEGPIAVTSIEDILQRLPPCANYTDMEINLFFSKEQLTQNELQAIMERFSQNDPLFEISIVRHDNRTISIGIGSKTGNNSTIPDGEFFGHTHPTHFKVENTEKLPKCFVAGLMPSSGDANGFFKHVESVKNGTRIFSKNGYALISLIKDAVEPGDALREFRNKYFDLFLGENKLGFKTDEETAEYFRQNLGLEIEFHYIEQKD